MTDEPSRGRSDAARRGGSERAALWWRVEGPEGEYLVEVEPAAGSGFFNASGLRWWRWLTRDKSWWLTVHRSDVAWAVLRERFASKEEAMVRAKGLVRRLRTGRERLDATPAWRRMMR